MFLSCLVLSLNLIPDRINLTGHQPRDLAGRSTPGPIRRPGLALAHTT